MPHEIKKFILMATYCCIINVLSAQYNYHFSQIDITKGLSHNRITSILKDEDGFMWFGTISGLNKYDGYGIKVFTHSARDSFSLCDNYILKLFQLPEGNIFIQGRSGSCIYEPVSEKFVKGHTYFGAIGLPDSKVTSIVKTGEYFWFLYADSGLYKVSPGYKVTRIMSNESDTNANGIADIRADSKNNLVVVYRNGLIKKLDVQNNGVIFSSDRLKNILINQTYDFSLFIDKQDNAWLYVTATPFGSVCFDFRTNRVRKLSKQNGILNNDIVNGITQDNKGKIWIGTDHGGINIIDTLKFKPIYIKNREDDNTSLSQNVITTLYRDDLGIIWLGTYKRGLNYFDEGITKFPLYSHHPMDKRSLCYDDVNRFAEDGKGNIWIGTNGGGLIYFDRHTNKFTQYRHDGGDDNTIGNDVIVSLWIDHEQKLWIGSYYGGLDCFDGKRFIHYRHKIGDPFSLSDDRVWEIYEDKKNNLWIGTFSGGLDKFDRETNRFYHYSKRSSNGLSSNYVSSLVEDETGNLWIGTDAGINVLDKTSNKIHSYNVQNGLCNDDIISMLEDQNNNIWIGTRNGLSVFNHKTKSFQSFTTDQGLPDNLILNILEDNNGNLWISTSKGLAKIFLYRDKDRIGISCKTYDEMDGLQSRDFNENAALKTTSGELIFGGANGFNIFNPAGIKENKNIPRIALTDFQLFNKNIAVGEATNNHIILPASINHTKEITLKYNENNFAIDFVALSYDNVEKNNYAYKLEGFNRDWLTSPSNVRRATYTNLDPGKYVFRVKASNDDGYWNNKGVELYITILPPFWKTPLAYILYLAVAVGILITARRLIIRRARARFAIEEERKEAMRMHELDLMKIKFLTNVSHEFKTPLSLILSPIDTIVKDTHEPAKKKEFQLIQRNARRLLHLVNQLLDFRKMEVQELVLLPTKGDIGKFIKETCYSFTDLAEKKNIRFFYRSGVTRLITSFDHDKLERILFNLLSNAFKFTPQNGSVSVETNTIRKNNDVLLEIKVIDTGIGIPKETVDKIFERFFQTSIPGSLINQGSGIGLAITREFVSMHNGSISVESEVNHGSCFTVLLPLKEISEEEKLDLPTKLTKERISMEIRPSNFASSPQETKNGWKKSKNQVVLLVEDNEDFRFYLKDNLNMHYTVIEAENGKEAWQLVLSMHPDIVVSDICMPIMDGIELCQKIKNDKRTKHIPVILLTALAGEENHLQSLETGVTDYMTKPFSFEILISRIRNILNQQKVLKKALAKHVDATTSDITCQSVDEKFIQQALIIIERNLSNAEFSVEDLSRELYISRVALYKRIFTCTGKSPLDFIRSIRLQRAAQLLEKSDLTVSEVAYEVGFNNPKYFSKFFKATFDLVPSAYQSKMKKSAIAPEDLNRFGTG